MSEKEQRIECMTRISKTFQIDEDQEKRISEWLHTQVYPAKVEAQRKTTEDPHPMMIKMWDEGYPYEGAIGGALTYRFTPTSIGTVFKVTYGEHELDLTDYDMW